MKWLQSAFVDIAITAVIVLWVFGILPDWAQWIVYIYTPLIAALKLIAFATGLDKVKTKTATNTPPSLFYHLLFAINVATLLYAHFAYRHLEPGIMAGLWVLTWILSALSERRKPA